MCLYLYLHFSPQKREEVPSATKPVFNRKPEKVEWWVAVKQEDFNLLSVRVLHVHVHVYYRLFHIC